MTELKKLLPVIEESKTTLFGEETVLSYPMPDIVGGVRVENFFLYYNTPSLIRSRPFGRITTSADTGEILVYENAHIRDFVDTARYPFTEKISYALPKKISVREFRLEQSLIYKMYEGVRAAAFRETPTKAEVELIDKFRVVLENSVPAALVPYYEAIGKNFYDWSVRYV